MSVGKFAFLPNLRSAAAAQAPVEGVRPRLEYELEIVGGGTAQGARLPVAARLMGPGDVVGLDPDQIMRIEPEDANKGFEPNYFPFVQLKDPDLPWRYTLDGGAVNRLTPWMVLIALKDDEFDYLDQGNALAPRIQVASASGSLPDLGQAWASAHVQVDMDGVTGTPNEVLLADPARGFARMFACRKLEAGTPYTLFIVPSYKVGRHAALGEPVEQGDGDALAWDAGESGAVILPYFFRHVFKTEDGQDLEVLLRKLRAVRADEEDEAGAPLWVSAQDVGYYDGLTSPEYAFAAQAALAQPEVKVPALDTPVPLRQKMAATLNSVLREQTDDNDGDEEQEDPLLTFPAYGSHYTGATEVSLPRAVKGWWFERVNIDLKFRAAAGLGQAIVRENDEHFAQLCWEQYDEVLAANQALRQLQLATQLAVRIDKQHFARLPSEAGMQLSEPLLDYVRVDPKDDRSASIAGQLAQKNLPRGYTSLALRRTLSRKPTRVVPTEGGKPDGKPTGKPQRRLPMAALPGDQAPSAQALPRDEGALRRREKALSESKALGEMSDALRGLFNPEMLGRKPRAKVPQAVVGSYSSKRIHQLVGAKLTALPRMKADHLIGGRSAAEAKDGGVIYRAPRVPEPLIDYLMRLSRDAVLSNAAALPENTVSFYQENRHFIEALMLGANHAMNEELRWREYPTDMRGTIFHRFWNRGAAPQDTSMDDIGALRDWTKKLGEHPNPADADGRANLVVVIKGEVVRKLNEPLVVVSIAQGSAWEPDTATDYNPVFFGKIGRDAVYYGFDISREYVLSDAVRERAYFAIYEPPARLRFGLDVGTATIRAARPNAPDLVLQGGAPALESWDDLSWAHMRLSAANYVDFSKNLAKPAQASSNYWSGSKQSAGLARSFWQKPLAALLPLGRVL